MSNIFFTSDTHYGHANIAGRRTSQWKDGYRNYNSVEEMNQDLVKNINKLVGPDDVLYHLGDWSFGGVDNIWKFRKQIVCQNIHLILGNHDHHIEVVKALPNVHFEAGIVDSNADYIPIDGAPISGQIEVQSYELFASVSHYKEVKTSAGVIVLSHYGMRVWHGSHKGWIHLYGHSHGSLPPFGKSIDVGVDSAKLILGEYRPFSLNEISNIMLKLDVEFVDHHESSTNTGKHPK